MTASASAANCWRSCASSAAIACSAATTSAMSAPSRSLNLNRIVHLASPLYCHSIHSFVWLVRSTMSRARPSSYTLATYSMASRCWYTLCTTGKARPIWASTRWLSPPRASVKGRIVIRSNLAYGIGNCFGGCWLPPDPCPLRPRKLRRTRPCVRSTC